MSCAYLTRFFFVTADERPNFQDVKRKMIFRCFSSFDVICTCLRLSAKTSNERRLMMNRDQRFFSFCSFLWPFLSSDSFETQRDRRKRQTGFRCEQRTLNEQRPSTPLPPTSFLLFERTRTKQLVASTDRTVGEQRFQFV